MESGWCQYLCSENNVAGWRGEYGWRAFNSIDECILYVAHDISTIYKEEVGGKLYNVCNKYCDGDKYMEEIINIMEQRKAVIEGIFE